MTRQKNLPAVSERLSNALDRLVHAGTLSTRAARRKASEAPRMNTRARIHARRFLKLYYATGVGGDPEIAIAADGSVTLKWSHPEMNPQTGHEWMEDILLTIRSDGSYGLAISEHGSTVRGEGTEAGKVLALRIARQSSGNRYTCVGCGADTDEINEYYSVTDEVWQAAVRSDTDYMLCIGCLEERIGRHLLPKDFLDVPINLPGGWPHSERLKCRLGHA